MAGKLCCLFDEHPDQCKSMNLKQIAGFAGDGNMLHEETSEDLRAFFSKIDLEMFQKYIDEALSTAKKYKFDDRGFVLQELVNEMGNRLGYKVTHGLFKGKKGDNGYDGLWQAPDGFHIVMESKTSDAYTPDMVAIRGYRDKLILDKMIDKEYSSILVVLGREDKGKITNYIKGDEGAPYTRSISTQSLFELVKLYTEKNEVKVQNQIFKLLMPRDYTLLDNLIELIFPKNNAGKGKGLGSGNGGHGAVSVGAGGKKDTEPIVRSMNQETFKKFEAKGPGKDKIVKGLFNEWGIDYDQNMNFSKYISGSKYYWMEPSAKVLTKDWSIVLFNTFTLIITVIRVPKDSLSVTNEGFKIRNDSSKQGYLELGFLDNCFIDKYSKVDFSKYITNVIKVEL